VPLSRGAGGGGVLARTTHAEVEAPEEVLELWTKHGIAFMPFFPLGVGAHAKPSAALAAAAERHRAAPAQICLAWFLARSPVTLPIPGTSRPEHLEENWKVPDHSPRARGGEVHRGGCAGGVS